jgi:hypothetical protein
MLISSDIQAHPSILSKNALVEFAYMFTNDSDTVSLTYSFINSNKTFFRSKSINLEANQGNVIFNLMIFQSLLEKSMIVQLLSQKTLCFPGM